jgi:peroxiredoxin family protein
MDQDTQKYIDEQVQKALDSQLKDRIDDYMKKHGPANRAAIVASKGSMDMAYPPLILASTCAALDIECKVFFTFYGLDIINKHKMAGLKVPPIANPAMPVPVPNIVGMLPGMTHMATAMMKSWMGKANVATVPELIEACLESDVTMIGCQMTMDVMGVEKEDLVDGVETGGAAYFLEWASRCNITLFI